MSDWPADYCPTCKIGRRDEQCQTATGRDHITRKWWRIAYDAGRAAATPATPDAGDVNEPLSEEDDRWFEALAEKWQRASEVARKSEHHWPADCLAEAAVTVLRIADERASREAVAATRARAEARREAAEVAAEALRDAADSVLDAALSDWLNPSRGVAVWLRGRAESLALDTAGEDTP